MTPHGTLAATGEPPGCVGAPRPFTVPAGAPRLARVPGVCAQGGVQWLPRPHGHALRPWTQGHLTHARRSFTAPTGVSPPTPPSPCLGGAPDSPTCVSAFTGAPQVTLGESETSLRSPEQVVCASSWLHVLMLGSCPAFWAVAALGVGQRCPLKQAGPQPCLLVPSSADAQVCTVSFMGPRYALPPAHKDPRMEKGPHGEERTEVTPGGPGARVCPQPRLRTLPTAAECWPASRSLPARCLRRAATVQIFITLSRLSE